MDFLCIYLLLFYIVIIYRVNYIKSINYYLLFQLE